MSKYMKVFDTQSEYDNYVSGAYPKPNVSYIKGEGKVEYNPYIDYSKQYFTTVALEDGTFRSTSYFWEYSTDGGSTWTALPQNTDTPTIPRGTKVMWKTNTWSSDNQGTLGSSGRFNVEGNILSLGLGDDFIGQTSARHKFTSFLQDSKVVNAQNLILPMTTLTESCYMGMFAYCKSLTTAPTLPATTLAGSCYQSMFYGCTSLNYIKAMFTTTPSSYFMSQWVFDVAPTGTFVKNSAATWDVTGVNGIPEGWTVEYADA